MLLILDIGTSSMRGMLMDCYGHMLKSIQKKIYLAIYPGWRRLDGNGTVG